VYFLTRERGANAKMYTLPKREVSPGIGPRPDHGEPPGTPIPNTAKVRRRESNERENDSRRQRESKPLDEVDTAGAGKAGDELVHDFSDE
jgi:hypothetical protein